MKKYPLYLMAVVLLVSVAWMGCTMERGPFAPSQVSSVAPATKPAARALEAVMAVQERHTARLMALEGVVGTATGLGADAAPVVVVLARRPGVKGIPGSLDGVPVAVRVTGEVYALKGKPPGTPGGGGGGGKDKESVDPTARFDRPVPMGVSTGHPLITAGTIGARVTDGTNVYALSNNHVYAAGNAASVGDNVLQPGAVDGGVSPDDAIGTLFDYEAITFGGPPNTIDAAIALSSTEDLGNATPSDGYGVPKVAIVEPEFGLKVKKYGRTTSLTKGSVALVNASVLVDYGEAGTALFEGQIAIQPSTFSQGGDSGSLVVVDGKGRDKAKDRKPVGLLFAGSSLYTFANPIAPVLDRFGVTVDGE